MKGLRNVLRGLMNGKAGEDGAHGYFFDRTSGAFSRLLQLFHEVKFMEVVLSLAGLALWLACFVEEWAVR